MVVGLAEEASDFGNITVAVEATCQISHIRVQQVYNSVLDVVN